MNTEALCVSVYCSVGRFHGRNIAILFHLCAVVYCIAFCIFQSCNDLMMEVLLWQAHMQGSCLKATYRLLLVCEVTF